MPAIEPSAALVSARHRSPRRYGRPPISIAIAIVIVLVILATACTGEPPPPPSVKRPAPTLTGRVISLDGAPIAGATVEAEGQRASTDSSGRFSLSASDPAWVMASKPGFLSRTRAGALGDPILFRLTPDDGHTISIHFGGDVMFGRRFYDPNEDGDTSDGQLQPGDGAAAHLALLAGVQPLLGDADVTVVNMETPLVDQPYIDPTRPRPASYHQTKSFVFASAPAGAQALAQAGVDVVGIGNNHLYDALDPGVRSTLRGLKAAGFRAGAGYFGGGVNEADAWKPAILQVKQRRIAFLGCTSETRPFERLGPTVAGHVHARPIPGTTYVAEDDTKGGAAACNEQKIVEAVRAARSRADVVVCVIHGGIEYWPLPSPEIQRMSNAAVRAGATLVVDGHPHVVSGFGLENGSLVAWSMGNLLFDQEVWPTFQSYLLDVDIRDGKLVQAYAEPVMMDNYRPQGVVGGLADHVARMAAGLVPVSATIEDGAAEIDVGHHAVPNNSFQTLSGTDFRGSVFHLPDGAWASSFSGDGRLEVGRDLLWVGSFEDEDVDLDRGETPLWDFEQEGVEFPEAAAYHGKGGARLIRQVSDCQDAVLTPLHRLLVEPGKDISIVGMARLTSSARASVQLSWYGDLKGPSSSRTVRTIEPTPDGSWRQFRLDATVPPHTVAVGLYVRLSPPSLGTSTADLDDLRVIEWAPQQSALTPLYAFIRVTGAGRVGISRPYLPGADPESGTTQLEPVVPSPSDLLLSSPPIAQPRPECETGG